MTLELLKIISMGESRKTYKMMDIKECKQLARRTSDIFNAKGMKPLNTQKLLCKVSTREAYLDMGLGQ